MLIGHQKQWDFLKTKFETDQLSHSYLFTGQEGIGKKTFAKEFSEFVGCKFPDLMIVQEQNERDPKFGDGGEIKISQIREVQNFLSYKSYNGGYKVVIVDGAEKMNQEAQSCFLKTLEEPKGKTLLFLISSKPDMLLPTILSRCQQIKFFRFKDLPENKEKLAREQDILKDLLPILNSDLAEKFKYVKALDLEKQNAGEIVYVLQKHFRKDVIKNKKILELTEDISKKLSSTNINQKLALEILLLEI
jgi:DNA polymerase-3 subunit delta'